jgi:hypothetical protein
MADGRRKMTLLKGLLVLGLVAAGLALSVQTVLPQSEADTDTAAGAVLTGDYCIECHLSGDERADSALDWGGGVYRQQSIPCDPVRVVREEDYHAGNLMLKIAQVGEDFSGDRVGAEDLTERLDPQRDNLDKLTQAEVESVTGFTDGAKAARFQAGKLLPEALDMHDETRRRTVILAIVFGTIFLAFLGVLGWERTLKK